MSPEDSEDDLGPTTVQLPRRSKTIDIGPYRLLQMLGAGGMGQVWLAEQTTPVRRTVAVKLIKPGMDSAHVIARFEAERQALALMTHPAIATVFDGGTTPDDRPYFAMEYVKGEPITTYCDRHQVDMTERLALFLQVCEGVQHAHQKGIIHRDIKPSNVLITIVDDHPTPKIIDFGLAKAMAQRLTERSIFTELGMLIGTPEYMSPEQADMGALDIDTRTDVYALGVMLYELLTGALPFDKATLRQAGFDGIRRLIRESEPPRPSTRVTRLGEASTVAARNRNTDPVRLARLLRGDLDWIVMKALEKDRTRRYGSASELVADLRRHIGHEPVLAGPPSAAYRVSKFVRRNRAGVAIGASVLALLVAFAVAMSVQAGRIAVERDIASRERDSAERISSFLASLFEASEPDNARGRSLTARDLLDNGRRRLESELKDQPQTRAALLHTIGRVYRLLGKAGEAETALASALMVRRSATGRERAALADTLNELANIYKSRGDIARAIGTYREVLHLRQEVFGPEDVTIARTLNNIANSEKALGHFADAERGLHRAIDIAARAGILEDAAVMQMNLASVLLTRDRLPEAIEVLRPAAAALQRIRGIENTSTLNALTNLATALFRASRLDEAERMQREILEVRRRMLGPDHYDVAVALEALGRTFDEEGRFAEAEQILRESVAVFGRALRTQDEEHAFALIALGSSLLHLNRFDEAEQAYREAMDVFQHTPHPGATAGWALKGIGQVFYARRQFEIAEDYFRKALQLRQTAGGTPYELEISEADLGRLLCERGSEQEGERLVRLAVEARRKNTLQDWETEWVEAFLGRCLALARRFDEAEPLLTKAYRNLVSSRGPTAVETRYVADVLAQMNDSRNDPRAAAEWRRKSQTEQTRPVH